MHTKPVIFINGMMKTGTTLLLNLFDGHKDVNVFPDETVFEILFKNHDKNLIDYFLLNNNCRLFRKIYGQKKHKRQSKSFEKIFTDELVNKNIDCNKFKKSFLELKNISEPYIFIINFFDIFFRSMKEDYNNILKKKYILYKSPSFTCPNSKEFLEKQINELFKISKKSKVIIPLRHPENLIKSLILHEERVHNKIFNHLKKFFFIIKTSYEIELTLKDYSKLNNEIYFFKYEDLLNDPKNELKKISNFLEINYSETLEYTSIFNTKISTETSPMQNHEQFILKSEKLSSYNVNLLKIEKFFISCFDIFDLKYSNNSSNFKIIYNYKSTSTTKFNILKKFCRKIFIILLGLYYKKSFN